MLLEIEPRSGNPICDKCGGEVPSNNDAMLFEAHLQNQAGNGTSADLLLVQWLTSESSRHLLPTDECEGSPSRAQYLTGEEDLRLEYSYSEDECAEIIYKQAYGKFLEIFG